MKATGKLLLRGLGRALLHAATALILFALVLYIIYVAYYERAYAYVYGYLKDLIIGYIDDEEIYGCVYEFVKKILTKNLRDPYNQDQLRKSFFETICPWWNLENVYYRGAFRTAVVLSPLIFCFRRRIF